MESEPENTSETLSSVLGRNAKRLKGYYGGPSKIPRPIHQIVNELPFIAHRLDDLRVNEELNYIVKLFQEPINRLNVLTTHPTKSDHGMGMTNYEKELFRILKEIEFWRSTFTAYFTDTASRSVPRKPVNKQYHYPEILNVNFIDRHLISRKIDETFHNPNNSSCPVVVLIGVGGCGKTQLASNFCQQSKEHGRFTGIFWVDASSPVSTIQGLSQIAGLIDPSVDHKDSAACIEIVKYGLGRWSDSWLIVFDNFEPTAFEKEKIEEYYPEGGNGAILFTSRNREVSYLGVTSYVDKMLENEAMELFLDRSQCIRSESNIKLGKEIVAKLGYHALAINLAAVYLSSRSAPPNQFLDQYNKRRELTLKHSISVWENGKKLSKEEALSSLSIFTTWEMTFGLTNSESKDLKKLLQFSAFLDNRYILEEIFKVYYESARPGWMMQFADGDDWSSVKYQKALAGLAALSLISDFQVTATGARFSLHPLVQDWVKLELNDEEYLQLAAEATLLVASYIDSRDLDTLSWRDKDILVSHVTKCLESEVTSLDDDSTDVEMISLLNAFHSFASVYYYEDMFNDAESLYSSALEGKELLLGDDKESTLITIHKLGCTYAGLGELDKAESMCKRALNISTKLLGHEDVLTFEILGDLGSIYQLQERLGEAENLYGRSLDGCEKSLPSDHRLTYEIMTKLADVYESQGKLGNAEIIIDRLLQNQEKLVGMDLVSMLNIANSLAIAYKNQQKLDKAENLYKRALLGFERVYKPDHKDTLTTVYNLAVIYHDRGKMADAERMYLRSMNGFEKIISSSRKDTPVIIDYLDTVHNLALIYSSKGALDKVEVLYNSSLNFLDTVLGANHRFTLTAAYYLASTYHGQGKLAQAEQMYKRTLDGFKPTPTTSANTYLTAIFNLGLVYEDQSKYNEAEAMFSRAKKEGEPILNSDNEFILDTNRHLTALRKKHKPGKIKKQFFSVFAR